MINRSMSQLAYVGATLVGVVGLVLLLQPFHRDEVGFCRRMLGALTTGQWYVQSSIDWEQFQALGVDVGSAYRELPNEEERAKFRQAFIMQCAEGFRKEHGRLGDFINWRLQQRGPVAMVAADYPLKQKTLLFQVSTIGEKRLQQLQWQ